MSCGKGPGTEAPGETSQPGALRWRGRLESISLLTGVRLSSVAAPGQGFLHTGWPRCPPTGRRSGQCPPPCDLPALSEQQQEILL